MNAQERHSGSVSPNGADSSASALRAASAGAMPLPQDQAANLIDILNATTLPAVPKQDPAAPSPPIDTGTQQRHTSTRELLNQLYRHIKNPRGLIISAKALFACAVTRRNGELLALPEEQDVRNRVLANISGTYLGALTTGYVAAAVVSQVINQKFDNTLITTASVILTDYLACTAALSSIWLTANRKFFFDKDKPNANTAQTQGAKRRSHFYALLRADLAVSGIIYGGTSLLSIGLNFLGKKVEALSFLSDVSGPINATLVYSCFLGIAAKNVVNFAKTSFPDFISFWKTHRRPFPDTYFAKECKDLAFAIIGYLRNPNTESRDNVEFTMRKILADLFQYRNKKKDL